MKETSEVTVANYQFFFENTGAWSSIFDFENFLGKAFESAGVEGVVVNSTKGSPANYRIVRLTDKPQPVPPQPPPTKNVSPSIKLKEMSGEDMNKKMEGKMRVGPLNSFPKRAVPKTQFNIGKRFSTKYK